MPKSTKIPSGNHGKYGGITPSDALISGIVRNFTRKNIGIRMNIAAGR
jgi:hypothetical protein